LRLCVLVASSCDAQFTATTAVNGTFASPGFPQAYPDDVTCRYRFTGHHGDRVQLRFTTFNLRYSTSDSHKIKNPMLEYEYLCNIYLKLELRTGWPRN